MVVWCVMFVAIIETIAVSILLLCLRHLIGRAYTNDTQLVNYIARMAYLISLSTLTDTLQAVISGIARGSGCQKLGAYVNLGAFYLVGIPAAVLLGFSAHLKARGLWIGILIGSVLQSFLLFIITALTDWKEQARKAKARMIQGPSSQPNH